MKVFINILYILLALMGCIVFVVLGVVNFQNIAALIGSGVILAVQVCLFVVNNICSVPARKERKNCATLILSFRTFSLSSMALEIVLMLMLYVVFDKSLSNLSFLYKQVYVLLLLFIVTIASVLFGKLLKSRTTKLAVYVSGVVLLLACFLVPTDTQWGIVVYYVMFFVGFGQIAAWLYSMFVETMRVAQISNLDNQSVRHMQLRDQLGAMIISQCVFALVVFADNLPLFVGWTTILQTLCSILLLVALFFAIKQPLDYSYSNKMDEYLSKTNPNINYELLQEQLQDTLFTRRKSVFVAVARALLKPFFPAKVIGKENVDTSHGAVVFVANHYEIYGPVVTVLRMPFRVRPWIHSRMLDKTVLADQMQRGVEGMFKKLPKKIVDKIPGMLVPLMYQALSSTEPIAVHRDSSREVINTFNNTVRALEQGDNILIFPEKPEEGQWYSQFGSVDSFYTGFADIGRMYYKKTGKSVLFYPVYVDKVHREIVIGQGVQFDGTNERHEEKQRIAKELNDSMKVMASNAQQRYDAEKNKKKK